VPSDRTFEDAPAVRSKVPLLLGLGGPSGGGKTFSAIRMGVGMQRVCGGTSS
jgi:pantothenate kinase-related protein Tda10